MRGVLIEESWVLAFIVERPEDREEFVTVFVPSAPMQLGVGSHAALRGKFNLPQTPS